MKSITFIIILAFTINTSMSQINNDIEIPKGVVYKKTTDAINEQAKKVILNELKKRCYK